MQWRFLKEKDIPSGDLEILVQNQKKILEYCAFRDIPVFVIEYFGEEETIMELRHLLSLLRYKIQITKYNDNAFDGTNLQWLLRRMGIQTLYIMGVAADACVQKTVIGAVNAGFNIVTGTTTMHPVYPKLCSWFDKHGLLAEDMFDALAKQRI